MTCEKAFELLNDYVDGSLDEAGHQEVELHLSTCPACRQEEKALAGFLAEVSTFKRESQPARDLWPGIAERIEADKGVLAFLRPGSLLRRYMPAALAAAAAAAIAIVSTLHVGPKPGASGTGPAGTPPTVAATGESDLEKAEADYVKATNQLITVLNSRRASMSPDAQKALDANIASIDSGLHDVRAALAKDPQNPKLTRMLASTHQKKLDLLLRLIRLSSQI
jgi:anti-sigma factor RsiW